MYFPYRWWQILNVGTFVLVGLNIIWRSEHIIAFPCAVIKLLQILVFRYYGRCICYNCGLFVSLLFYFEGGGGGGELVSSLIATLCKHVSNFSECFKICRTRFKDQLAKYLGFYPRSVFWPPVIVVPCVCLCVSVSASITSLSATRSS